MKTIVMSHSNLVTFIAIASVLLSMSLIFATGMPLAEARQSHPKAANKQLINQTTACNDSTGRVGGGTTVSCVNMATAILCEHATCIIGGNTITPFLIPIPHPTLVSILH